MYFKNKTVIEILMFSVFLVNANYSLAANLAPSKAVINNPLSISEFYAPADIVVSATAEDSDGTIAVVAFYINGVLVGQDNTFPYQVTIPSVEIGTQALKVKAYDNLGASRESAVVTVNVLPAINDPIQLDQGRILHINFDTPIDANGNIANLSPTGIPVKCNKNLQQCPSVAVGPNGSGAVEVLGDYKDLSNTGDYMYADFAPELDNMTQGSISYWVKYRIRWSIVNGRKVYTDINPTADYILDAYRKTGQDPLLTQNNDLGDPGTWAVTRNWYQNNRMIAFTPTRNKAIVVEFKDSFVFLEAEKANANADMRLWHHYTITWDGTTVKAYLDGNLHDVKSQANFPKFNFGVPTSTYTPYLAIAASGHNSSRESGPFYPNDGFLHGSLDDLRIYNRPLNPKEIQELVRIGSVPSNQAPVANAVSAVVPFNTTTVINLSGSDPENQQLTYAIASGTQAPIGQVTITGNQANYVPLAGFSGNDTFYYVVSDGVSTSSPAAVSIRVNALPSISWSSPANNSVFTQGQVISLSAIASDDVGVKSVEFFNGSVSLGVDPTAPYQLDWTNASAGAYSLTAMAKDIDNAVKFSTPLMITVNPDVPSGDNQPPSLQLSSSVSTLFAPASTTLVAEASDADGIAKVEFYKDSTLIATYTKAPYFHVLSNLVVGNYVYKAKAYDTKNVVTESTVSFSVVKGTNVAGTVAVTSPSTGSTFSISQAIPFTAQASDPDNPIVEVQYYRGTYAQPFGRSTQAPFTYQWISPFTGTYQIKAKAIDSKGGVSTSDVITVNITK